MMTTSLTASITTTVSTTTSTSIPVFTPPALTPRLLSIQSHTVHGYVGNKAAVFPLQMFGFDVDTINTISLSNHPAYPKLCKGYSTSPQDFQAIIEGLKDNELLNYDVILSGYCKSPEVLTMIQDTISYAKTTNPKVLYFLDPVLGDNGRYYVPSELMDIYKSNLLPLASVITPNQFEAEVLSGVKIESLSDILQASKIFHDIGVKIYVQKGLKLPSDPSNHLNVLASIQMATSIDQKDQNIVIYRKEFPKLSQNFSGCGDLFSALMVTLVSKYYSLIISDKHKILGDILDMAVVIMTTVLEKTDKLSSRELTIIESSEIFQAAKVAIQTSSSLANIVSSPSLLLPSVGNKAHLMKGSVVGVIFDMDGTLTEPGAINFQAMYDRIGLKRGGHADGVTDDILSMVKAIESSEERLKAYEIIEEEEDFGCQRMKLRPGVEKMLSSIDSHRIRLAISTRNIRKSVDRFLDLLPSELHDVFSHMITRDCVNGINKPDPRVAWHIMNAWGYLVDYDQQSLNYGDKYMETMKMFGDVWFVGDSIDDMRCGKAAGCKTCIITTSYNRHIDPSLIDLRVSSLEEFSDAILLDL